MLAASSASYPSACKSVPVVGHLRHPRRCPGISLITRRWPWRAISMTLPRTDEDEDELHPIDKEALERAIAMTRANGGPSAVQIENKLRDEPWEQVARFAAYCR